MIHQSTTSTEISETPKILNNRKKKIILHSTKKLGDSKPQWGMEKSLQTCPLTDVPPPLVLEIPKTQMNEVLRDHAGPHVVWNFCGTRQYTGCGV
jgi:hypothetical protein